MVLPPKAAGFVTDIHIPHSWYTVDDGSQFCYARISASGTELGIRVQLSKGNYTGEELAAELQTLLRTELAGLTAVNAGSQIYVQYHAARNTLRYSLSAQLNFTGTWASSTGQTYELTAGSGDTYTVTERGWPTMTSVQRPGPLAWLRRLSPSTNLQR